MSSRPSPEPSPSRSPEPIPRSISEDKTTSQQQQGHLSDSVETPQSLAGHSLQPTPTTSTSISSHELSTAQLVTSPLPTPGSSFSSSDSTSRRGRPLVVRHHTRRNSSQPPLRNPLPYSRVAILQRASSQPRSVPEAMSSASSSPASTSTAGTSTGSTSGSNPTYQLPYAPFPYPMPPKGNSGGSGSGK